MYSFWRDLGIEPGADWNFIKDTLFGSQSKVTNVSEIEFNFLHNLLKSLQISGDNWLYAVEQADGKGYVNY